MTTLNNVVLFVLVLVLFGSVVPADAQTRAEQAAYDSLWSAVQSVQSEPTTERIAAVRPALRQAHSVFQQEESRRDEADRISHDTEYIYATDDERERSRRDNAYTILLGQFSSECRGWWEDWDGPEDTRVNACQADHYKAANLHARYMWEGMDTIIEVSVVLQAWAERFGIRSPDTLQRMLDARAAAVSYNQLVLESSNEIVRPGNGALYHGFDFVKASSFRETGFDPRFSALVDASVAVVDAIVDVRRAEQAEQEPEPEQGGTTTEQEQADMEPEPDGTTAEQQRADLEQEPEPENLGDAWAQAAIAAINEAAQAVADIPDCGWAVEGGALSAINNARSVLSGVFTDNAGQRWNVISQVDRSSADWQGMDNHLDRLWERAQRAGDDAMRRWQNSGRPGNRRCD